MAESKLTLRKHIARQCHSPSHHCGLYPAVKRAMMLWMTRITGFIIGAGFALWTLSAPSADAQWFSSTPPPLADIESDLAERHEDISHIEPEDFLKMRAAGEDFIVLDVREKSEFEVSHIAGAVQIDPGARATDVKDLLAQAGADETTPVMLYCSVGQRSSRLGSRIVDALDGREVINLRGGVFAWNNSDLPLENAAGTTKSVHPYNTKWGKLVERSENIAYKPADP